MEKQPKSIYRKQMAQCNAACTNQVVKRDKKPLEESSDEKYLRISKEQDSKKIKRAKSAAKASIKRKEMKTIGFYFKSL